MKPLRDLEFVLVSNAFLCKAEPVGTRYTAVYLLYSWKSRIQCMPEVLHEMWILGIRSEASLNVTLDGA